MADYEPDNLLDPYNLAKDKQQEKRGRGRPKTKSQQKEDEKGEKKIELTPEELQENEDYYELLMKKVEGNMGLLVAEYPYHTEIKSEMSNENVPKLSMCSISKLIEYEQTKTGTFYLDSTFSDQNKRPFILKDIIKDSNLSPAKRFPPCAESRPKFFVCRVEENNRVCGEECKTIYELRLHLRDVHDRKSSENPVCPVCLKIFPLDGQFAELQKCMQSHIPVQEEKPHSFMCVSCMTKPKTRQALVFTQILRMRDHYSAHYREKFVERRLYYCGICDTPADKDTKRSSCQKSCIRNKSKFACKACNKDFGYDVEAKFEHFKNTHIESMFHCYLHQLGKNVVKPKKNAKLIFTKATSRKDGILSCQEENCNVSIRYSITETPEMKFWSEHFKQAHPDRCAAYIDEFVEDKQSAWFYKQLVN